MAAIGSKYPADSEVFQLFALSQTSGVIAGKIRTGNRIYSAKKSLLKENP